MTHDQGAVTSRSSGVFDYPGTISRLGGDVTLFNDLVAFFLEDAFRLLKSVRDNQAADDHAGVARAAHSLKGQCSNFGAQRAVSAAAAIEESALAGQGRVAGAVILELAAAIDELCGALSHFAADRANGNG